MFLILLTNALFALTYIVGEYTLHFISPLALLMYRMLFSGCILMTFQYISDKKKLYIKKADLSSFIFTIFLHMSLNFFCETYALQKVSGLMVSLFYLLAPIFSAIIDRIIKKNMLTKTQIAIISLSLIFSLLMIFINKSSYDPVQHNGIDITSIWPYCLLLLSIWSSTLGWYRVKDLTESGYALVSINAYASLFSGILFLCMRILVGEIGSISFLMNEWTFSDGIIGSLFLGLIGNVFAYNVYQYLFKYYTITAILLAEILCPCFTSLYLWLLFGIIPYFNYIVFFILFLMLIFVFNYKERNKKQII
jgi:drug/metabolite transporter (DMT)-like permease